jgi:hypothetical protein
VRWVVRLALLLALIAAWAVDAHLKGGDQAGYVPENVQWVAYSLRFGNVLGGVMRTPAFRNFNKQWPMPYNEACVYVRLTTGVRPTPIRWNTWLGKKGIVFGTEKGVGWCVRPGLLLRAADGLNRLFNTPAAPGVFRYGPYFYSWRDGFLLFSTTQDIVKAAATGKEYKCPKTLGRSDLYAEWLGGHKGYIVLTAQANLPVRGELMLPQRLADSWKSEPVASIPWFKPPLLELSSNDCSTVCLASGMLRDCFGVFPEWCGLGGLVPDPCAWGAAAKRDSGVSNTTDFAACGLALFEPSAGKPEATESKAPVPAMRFRFPKDPFYGDGAPIPGLVDSIHLRSRNEVTSAPVATLDNLEMKAMVGAPFWYLSPSQALVDSLAVLAAPTNATDKPFQARVEWDRTGKVLEMYFRSLLEQDETLQEQIEGTAIPAMHALSGLGKLHLEGDPSDDHLSFHGELAVAKAETPQGNS